MKLLSCYWCYVDNYPENFEGYKGVTFCYDCIHYHGDNNIRTIYKKFLEISNPLHPELRGRDQAKQTERS